MWRNPNPSHQPPSPQGPPEDRGERLATLPRGQGEELRVSLDEYEGRPYISLRVWSVASDGSWWPTKKGCSVRIREISEVARALMVARDLIEGPRNAPARRALPSGRGQDGPVGHRQPEGRRPEAPAGELPGLAGDGEDEFSEFR